MRGKECVPFNGNHRHHRAHSAISLLVQSDHSFIGSIYGFLLTIMPFRIAKPVITHRLHDGLTCKISITVASHATAQDKQATLLLRHLHYSDCVLVFPMRSHSENVRYSYRYGERNLSISERRCYSLIYIYLMSIVTLKSILLTTKNKFLHRHHIHYKCSRLYLRSFVIESTKVASSGVKVSNDFKRSTSIFI